MGSTENFCLRWNDFESNVSGAFQELRAESDFFDVTLVCDSGGHQNRPLQAHKVILSACSPFFRRMLRSVSVASPGHPNPLLYLRGVQLHDLEAILDFMYHGEVNVAQDSLNSFLAVAKDLQVKGLTQQNSKDLGMVARRAANRKTSLVGSSSGSSSRPPTSTLVKRRRQDNDVVDSINTDGGEIGLAAVKNEAAAAAARAYGSTTRDVLRGGGVAERVPERYADRGGEREDADNFDESFGGYSAADGDEAEGGQQEEATLMGGRQKLDDDGMKGDNPVHPLLKLSNFVVALSICSKTLLLG